MRPQDRRGALRLLAMMALLASLGGLGSMASRTGMPSAEGPRLALQWGAQQAEDLVLLPASAALAGEGVEAPAPSTALQGFVQAVIQGLLDAGLRAAATLSVQDEAWDTDLAAGEEDTGDTGMPDPDLLSEEAWLAAIDLAVNAGSEAPRRSLAQVGRLWLSAPSTLVEEEALAALVLVGGSDWDQGYRGRFLRAVAPGAIRHGRTWRVLPSVAMAQAILESGWGRSNLSATYNNLFGIKAGASDQAVGLPTREHQGGAMRRTRQRFRTFESWEDSLAYHARLLGSDRRYAEARSEWTDAAAYIKAIAPTYASNPSYARTITGIIHRYHLDRFDALVVRGAELDAVDEAEAVADLD